MFPTRRELRIRAVICRLRIERTHSHLTISPPWHCPRLPLWSRLKQPVAQQQRSAARPTCSELACEGGNAWHAAVHQW